MNKKASIFTTIVVLMFIVALITLFASVEMKYKAKIGDTDILPGFYASAIISTYQEQEARLLYLDLVSEILLEKSIVELGDKGGFNYEECGNSGYNYWNNENKETCFPNQKENLKTLYLNNFEEYFSKSEIKANSNKDSLKLEFENEIVEIVNLPDKKITMPIIHSGISGDECETIITGEPSITIEEIKKELKKRKSPALDSAEIIYNKGVEYGIDPVFALGFFNQESSMGTAGVAARTNSFGNKRVPTACKYDVSACKSNLGTKCEVTCSNDNCDYAYCSEKSGCFCGYNDWEKSIDDWYKLMSSSTYIKGGLDTIEKIIPKYAPSSDNNNEEAYIHNLKKFAEKYKDIECLLGSLTYTTGFKAQTKFDLSTYDKLKKFSEKTMNECKDNLEICVYEKMDEFNKENSEIKLMTLSQCESGEKKVFYDFVENFQDCLDSWGDDCKCKITNEYDYNHIEEMKRKETYRIVMKKINETNKYLIELAWPEIINATLKIEDQDFWIPEEYSFRIRNNINSQELNLKKNDENYVRINNTKNLFISINDNKKEMGYNTNKDENKLKIIRNNDGNEEISEQKHTRTCIQEKNTFRLCAETKYKFPIINEKYKETISEQETSKIKFALLLDDKIAPANIEKLNITTNKENIMYLNWTQRSGEDLGIYNITYSDNKSSNIYKQLIEFYLNQAILVFEDVEKENNPSETIIKSDNTNIKIEEPIPTKKDEIGKLYYYYKEGELFYETRINFEMEDEKEYTIKITGIDTFQNKNEGVEKSI